MPKTRASICWRFTASCRADSKRSAGLFRSVTAATDKPVLAFGRSTYSCLDESRAFQEEAGMPFLQAIKPTLTRAGGFGFVR